MDLCSPVLVHQTGEPTSGPLEESTRVRKATWADRCPRSNLFPLARPLPTHPDFLARHLANPQAPKSSHNTTACPLEGLSFLARLHTDFTDEKSQAHRKGGCWLR